MKTVIYNGDILTMENEEMPEAILIENERIQKIGSKSELIKMAGEDTQLIDLQGKCLMPSFIDSHSHASAFTITQNFVNLAGTKSFKEIIEKIKEFKDENNIKENEWIMGFGYDHNFMEEKKHPDRYVLDSISMSNPILIAHQSGHMGVVNSKALEVMKIDKNTQSPSGGKIGKDEETNEPTGYLEENAMINASQNAGKVTMENMIKAYQKVEKIYLSNGITTVQDGFTKKSDFELLKMLAETDKLNIDVVSYLDMKTAQNIVDENNEYVNKYLKHYKIGGYKLILDGSPQGRTAWLSKPYEGEKEYRGYPAYNDEELEEYIRKAIKQKMQILIHCNGDAASEQMIKIFEKISKDMDITNARPVMIHAQTVRQDQLPRMKKLGIIPSFFVAHTYYWGDIHYKNLGEERAYRISPMKSALKEGLVETLHQDTPVIEPNMIESIWCAVNRITRSGRKLGEEECISVYDALKAVTINSAYQYFEENEKGSLKEGKLANMIILDKNPLKINKEDINKIKVLETWKNGKKLYQI